MPKQIKCSISAAGQRHDALLPTLVSSAEELYPCHVNGCQKAYKNPTDLSRHKWVHLPAHLCPTCPFEGPFGQRCSKRYVGRASQIKSHWQKDHREAGPYPPGIKWPLLVHILRINNIDPLTFTARTSPFTSSASSLDQVADVERTEAGDSSGRIQPHLHLSPSIQHHFAATQRYNVVPQEYVQPVTPMSSFNLDSTTTPHYVQYVTTPVYSALDNGFQPATWDYPQEYLPPLNATSFINTDSSAVPCYAPIPIHSTLDYGVYPVGWEQYVPPFNQQLENQDWDLSLTNDPSGCDPEWGQFAGQV